MLVLAGIKLIYLCYAQMGGSRILKRGEAWARVLGARPSFTFFVDEKG